MRRTTETRARKMSARFYGGRMNTQVMAMTAALRGGWGERWCVWLLILGGLAACSERQERFTPKGSFADEVCVYQVTTAQYGVEGPSVEVRIRNTEDGLVELEETLYGSTVWLDPETLLPKRSKINHQAEDGLHLIEEEFLPGHRVRVERKGPLSHTNNVIELFQDGYHFHSLMLLFRAVDLVRGNTIRFKLFSPYAKENVRARMTVEGKELVTHGETTEEACRIHLRFADYNIMAWVRMKPPHRVIRLNNGVMDMRLRTCR